MIVSLRTVRAALSSAAVVLGSLVAFNACRSASTSEVVVYTSVDQVFSEIAEAQNRQADVFWSGDPVRPFPLIERGLIEPYVSTPAAGLPANARASEGAWTGFAARARVLLVNKSRFPTAEMPRGFRDLTSRRRRGQTAIANPLLGTATMQLAALFSVWGEGPTRAFLDALNGDGVYLASSNGEAKRLVVSGEVASGLSDTDYAHEAMQAGADVAVVYPDDDELGTLVIPTSVVLMRHAPGDRGRGAVVNAPTKPRGATTRVFVYGTLLRGEPNHGLLARARFVAPGRTAPSFELRNLGAFPGMLPGGSHAVVGEVYDVAPATLAALDRLEGHPHYFRRTAMELEGAVAVETYLILPEQAEGRASIDSGSWRSHRKEQAA
jgi:ABC-type Fe3+ transport system substrate-binding protein/gamma-glutamylcyclotransferase (GGCT)/AIG2-like uncharacterized protein YtfP